MLLAWLFLGAVFPAQPSALAQAPGDRVGGEVARFFNNGRTFVNGFLRIPHRMLTGVNGVGGFAVYKVDFRVTDRSGTVLASDGWTRRVPWEMRNVPGSESVEPFVFAVAPGSYDVQVAVEDSASGARQTVELPVTGFTTRPEASDLLLAYSFRVAGGGDTIPAASEVRKGSLFIATAPDLTLTPDRATLSYYCEVYRDSAGAVPWLVRVVSADGRPVVATAVTATAVAPGGGRIAASLDLAGLPPGTYTLALVLGADGDTIVRSAPFRMGGFETVREVAQAQAATEPRDRFSDASEAQLDSMFEPLVYVAEAGELAVYKGLTFEGKQRFLRAFWRRRDSSPGTRENEDEAAFYQRIDEANRRFREGGAGAVPGWRTDRGRVFIRYGEPDDVLREPVSGPDRPWEAWKYTRKRAMKFVFLDMTRVGNYSLVYSNDRLERTPDTWGTLLSVDAQNEIAAF